jgi:phosphotriesterase-related protein
VRGELDVKQLGKTLCHEHLLFDLSGYLPDKNDPFHSPIEGLPVTIENLGAIRRDAILCRDNLTQLDSQLAINEASFFRRAGGNTIVDCTTIGLKRDVRALKKISEATDLNIIAGAGYYIDRFHPADIHEKTFEDLATQIIGEIQDGVEGSGIRCGIIGEIGTSWPITTNERKVLKAVAYAHQKTKAPINVHPDPYEKQGHCVLDILEQEGADLSKIVMSHTDACGFDTKYHMSLAERGCYVEFDGFGSEFYYDSMGTDQTFPGKGQRDQTDLERITSVCALLRAGYASQILLSHDVCLKMQLRAFGGYGYDHLLINIIPSLKKSGVKDDQLNQMLIENPMRMLGV